MKNVTSLPSKNNDTLKGSTPQYHKATKENVDQTRQTQRKTTVEHKAAHPHRLQPPTPSFVQPSTDQQPVKVDGGGTQSQKNGSIQSPAPFVIHPLSFKRHLSPPNDARTTQSERRRRKFRP